MKVLITGGTGYLAAPLALQLRAQNVDVILSARDISKLRSCEALKGMEFRTFDISDPETYEGALRGVDTIIHLAAMGASACEKNPELATLINVEMVEKLLDEACNTNVRSFIYFSTVHVYGTPLEGEFSERNVPNPANVYAKTHFLAEQKLLARIKAGAISGKILRLSNAVGGPIFTNPEVESLVCNSACKSTVVDKKISIRSAGLAYRDFVPLQRIGKVLLDILHSKSWTLSYSIINVSSGNSFRILDIIGLVSKRAQATLGFSPEIETGKPGDEISKELKISNVIPSDLDDPSELDDAIDSTLIFYKKIS